MLLGGLALLISNCATPTPPVPYITMLDGGQDIPQYDFRVDISPHEEDSLIISPDVPIISDDYFNDVIYNEEKQMDVPVIYEDVTDSYSDDGIFIDDEHSGDYSADEKQEELILPDVPVISEDYAEVVKDIPVLDDGTALEDVISGEDSSCPVTNLGDYVALMKSNHQGNMLVSSLNFKFAYGCMALLSCDTNLYPFLLDVYFADGQWKKVMDMGNNMFLYGNKCNNPIINYLIQEGYSSIDFGCDKKDNVPPTKKVDMGIINYEGRYILVVTGETDKDMQVSCEILQKEDKLVTDLKCTDTATINLPSDHY